MPWEWLNRPFHLQLIVLLLQVCHERLTFLIFQDFKSEKSKMNPWFLFIFHKKITLNNCSVPPANQKASRQQKQIGSKSNTFSKTDSQVYFRKLKWPAILQGWELRTENVHKVNPVHNSARSGLVLRSYWPELFSRLDFKGIKQLNFYRFPSKMHVNSSGIKMKSLHSDILMNSLSKHSCYQYLTSSCTKKKKQTHTNLKTLSSPVYAIFRMPIYLSLFYRFSLEHLFIGRADTISRTSTVSHSYLITKGSAKNEGWRVSRKKARMQEAFCLPWECVYLSQNSTWQEWITQVLKNSQEINE